MVAETVTRGKKSDPARGDWCVQGKEMNVWVDASSQAIGVLLEKNGVVTEDAGWLRPMNHAAHINLAELDGVLKGINLALQWGVKVLHVRTDSLCMYHWVSDTLLGKARVRTKAASEMLIRRRLSAIKKLAAEYELCMDVTMVTSNCNLAEGLTRVPQKWYESMKKGDELAQPVCAASMEELDEIAKIHHLSGNPGVRRTCYFVRLTNPSVSTSAVRDSVKRCQTYQSIDPASVKWQKGKLGVGTIYQPLRSGRIRHKVNF